MKKLIYVIALSILLNFVGCEQEKATQYNHIQNNEPLESTTPVSDSVEMKEQPKPETELLYKNEKGGYQLEFPLSWKEYFIIDNLNDNGSIRIKFYGRSKTGTIGGQEYFGGGLPMFFILREEDLKVEYPLDSVREIGTVDNIKYYFATGTGSDISALFSISDPQSAVYQTAEYEIDQRELELAMKDWEKAKEMFDEIDSILKTFKPLK